MKKLILLVTISLIAFSSFAQLKPSLIGITKSPTTPPASPIESILITTTSTRSDWQVDELNNTGETLVWRVTGGVELPEVTLDRPILDLSTNTGSAIIRVESTTGFAGLTRMDLDGHVVSKLITDIDLMGAVELDTFSCKDEVGLQTLDVSKNTALLNLVVRDNQMPYLDISDLTLLENIWAYGNQFTLFDVSNNPLLTVCSVKENLLPSSELDKIVNDLAEFGLSNGTLTLSLNAGSLTSNSYDSYQLLDSRGWTIDVVSPPNPTPPSGDAPLLSNFIVDDLYKDRVYFDSSEVITATTTTGFVIYGKTISSININSNSTTGHYFLLADELDFWDNNLIEYTGGSNIQDTDSHIVYDFTLQHIDNLIDEPVGNQPDKYVTTSGGTGAGTIGDPWSFEYAGQSAVAGTTVWVKAGNYGADNIVIANNGTADNPIKFIGYDNTIGDAISLNRQNLFDGVDTFDSSVMPMLSNGSGSAIYPNNKNFIILRNIQIEGNYGYERGIYINNSTHVVVDNCYLNETTGHLISTHDGDAGYNRVINCYVSNSHSGGATLQNEFNLFKNTWAVSTYAASMDYYLTITGGYSGISNAVIDCTLKRFIDDTHSGHGISFKADQHGKGYYIEHSLVENCDLVNVKLELRHRPVKYNVFRDISITGSGVSMNDGCSYNTLENIYITNTLGTSSVAFRFKESVEDVQDLSETQAPYILNIPNENPHHNVFKNCIVETSDFLFNTSVYFSDFYMLDDIDNNHWYNCTFKDIRYIWYNYNNTSNAEFNPTNTFENCIMERVGYNGIYENAANMNPTILNSDLYDSYWTASGTNFNVDPLLDVNLKPLATFTLIDVAPIPDVFYDKNKSQRNSTLTTAGAIKHASETN